MNEGITCFTQCIMPDASCRIRDSAIQSMATTLLSLTSLYPNADIENHPRLCVLFNNVSKFQPKQKLMQQYGGGSDDDFEYSEDE